MAAFGLSWLLTAAVRADDWPQWRGPNRDGVWNETGIMESFPPSGLEIAWRVSAGPGWSSPVVTQGRVFLTDAELMQPSAKERIRCFDEATGAALWTHEYAVSYPEFAFVPGQGGGPTPTPIVDADLVYAIGANGHVHCLDARKGSPVWERDLGKDYEVRSMQCRPSPLIEGDLLIVFVGAKPAASVIAFDRKTGREVWKALNDPVSSSSPMVIQAGGRRQLIVWTDVSVTSLDPASGKVWWREPMVTSGNDSIPTPVVEKDRLLISGLMFELNAGQPSATVLWPANRAPSKRLLSNTSSPMLRGGHVYSAKSSGELVCLDAATGKLVWQTSTVTGIKSGASIHLTPTRDAVLLFTDQGELIRAQLTPQGYREQSRAKLIEPTTPFAGRNCAWPPPAYANGHVFARSDKELVCASLKAKR